jgi:hypothetical protein
MKQSAERMAYVAFRGADDNVERFTRVELVLRLRLGETDRGHSGE